MDFTQDIAALESLFFKETQNYHSSASLLGKPWYAIALEDNEKDTIKDSINKKNIVMRIFEAIKTFLKRIIEKVKTFVGKKTKSTIASEAAIVKNYDGSSDVESVIKEIESKLTEHRMLILLAMLSGSFHTVFAELMDYGNEITKNGGSVSIERVIDDLSKIDELNKLIQTCNDEINECANLSEEKRKELLRGLAAGDSDIESRTDLYFQQTYNSLESITLYFGALCKTKLDIYKETSNVDTEPVQQIQKLTKELTHCVNLVVQVSSVANIISVILVPDED